MEFECRIVVCGPPRGVAFALQRGKSDLVSKQTSGANDLVFPFSFKLAERNEDPPDPRGPFVQGRRGERFVYINSGTLGGQHESCWSRRAKVSFKGLTRKLIDQLAKSENCILEARIVGTSKDGGPVCASTPLLGDGWQVVSK